MSVRTWGFKSPLAHRLPGRLSQNLVGGDNSETDARRWVDDRPTCEYRPSVISVFLDAVQPAGWCGPCCRLIQVDGCSSPPPVVDVAGTGSAPTPGSSMACSSWAASRGRGAVALGIDRRLPPVRAGAARRPCARRGRRPARWRLVLADIAILGAIGEQLLQAVQAMRPAPSRQLVLAEAHARGVDLADLSPPRNQSPDCRPSPAWIIEIATTFTTARAATYRPYWRLTTRPLGDRRLAESPRRPGRRRPGRRSTGPSA